MFLEFIIWFAISIVAMSYIEYASHRYPMHSKAFSRYLPFLHGTFEKHLKFHHQRFYQDFEHDPDPVAKYINLDMNPFVNTIGLAPLWLPILFVSVIGAITFASVIFLHAILWSIIHTEQHEPKGRWFSKNSVYQYLKAYHKTHHNHPGTNFNVLFIGMDHVFRTYRKPQ